jgi:nitroreductase
MKLSSDEQLEILAEVARAPSVHNIQPARWRFADDALVLFRAVNRTLPVADPTGHDVQVSLGAAFEGMAIALSVRRMRLAEPRAEKHARAAGCEPVMRASIERGRDARPDALAPFVARRRSFRGKFGKPQPDDATTLATLATGDVKIIAADALDAVARLHDDATWRFERRPEYHRELWSWLRLSPDHPCYNRDGLNADCLALSAFERRLASRLLEPSRFAWLTRLGVARHLISEKRQVTSASAAILFCPRRDASVFDVGRRFYRLWLEVTRLGFHLAPMSATADDEHSRSILHSSNGIGNERRIANVFRIGRIPDGEASVSPRLPVGELLA